ncbi:MAG: hydrogenase [Hydrogenimonas sp.]|nr:hydrogenase [Hydrogenimonas sp.]
MSIVQKIEYKIDYDYFAGFIQNLIDMSGVKGYVSQESDANIKIVLSEDDAPSLERFAKLTQKYLPNSILLGKVETLQSDEPVKNEKFISKKYPLAPCPICLEEITEPSSERYLDDTIECRHYSNKEAYLDDDQTLFSPHYNENDTILITDSRKATDLFFLTEEEIKALFSIEKPTLKVTIKDEELKSITKKSFFRVKAPYNIKSVLAALSAKESEIEYLFFNERENEPKVIVIKDRVHMIYDNRISKPLKNLSDDRAMNRFLNAMDEAGYDSAVCAYLSLGCGISFYAYKNSKGKKVVDLGDFSLKKSLQNMESNPIRSKLLNNFKNSFANEWSILENSDLDIFATAAAILGLEENSYEAISDKALEFRGNGGLKIDMNFNENGLDYESMIGSIMSFKIAGAENSHLAYSIFEAIGDMAISVTGQLKQKLKIEETIFLGDIFENSVLFSRILSKLQSSNPFFPTKIALDYNR